MRTEADTAYRRMPGYIEPPPIGVPAYSMEGVLRAERYSCAPDVGYVVDAALRAIGIRYFYRKLSAGSAVELLRKRRRPVPAVSLWDSVTIALESDETRMIERASGLLAAVARVRGALLDGTYPQAKSREVPLEMGQYLNLFGTSVVPVENGFAWRRNEEAEGFAVLVGKKFYVVETAGGGWGVERIRATLTAILEESRRTPEEEVGPGIVSVIRSPAVGEILRGDEANRRAGEALRRSMVVLCLEPKETPISSESAARLAQAANLENRWFNSSLQLVVFRNGMACGIVAFSAGVDGNVMSRALSDINATADRLGREGRGEGGTGKFPYRQLEWRIPPGAVKACRRAVANYVNHERAVFTLKGIGSDFLMKTGIRPVPLFAMVFQVALARLLPGGTRFRVLQFLTREMFNCMGCTKVDVTIDEIEAVGSAVARLGLSASGRAYMELHDAHCREARGKLSHADVLNLLASDYGTKAAFSVRLLRKLLPLFAQVGLVRSTPPVVHVNISAPVHSPGVGLIGRPGITAQPAGLSCHYQIRRDQIVLTFMRGSLEIEISKLVDEIEGLLRSMVDPMNPVPRHSRSRS